MFFTGIALLSIFAFSSIGVDLLPNVNIPRLIVQTSYRNSTPEEVEKQITEPLESAIVTIPGIKKLTSVSKEGMSVISIDFVWGTDMKYAILSLREKLDNVSIMLPREAERPVIIKTDPSAAPILTLVLSFNDKENSEKKSLSTNEIMKYFNASSPEYVDHDSPQEEIQRLINLKEAGRTIFKRRFEQIEGIAQAVITGGLEREILVNIDPVKLNLYNITFDDIERSLDASNINILAGSIMKGFSRYSLRILGEFQNVNDIKNTIVKRNYDGSIILLKDIASVIDNFKEREGFTRDNGYEAIGILIYKAPDANAVSIAQAVKETINSLHKEYPEYK